MNSNKTSPKEESPKVEVKDVPAQPIKNKVKAATPSNKISKGKYFKNSGLTIIEVIAAKDHNDLQNNDVVIVEDHEGNTATVPVLWLTTEFPGRK